MAFLPFNLSLPFPWYISFLRTYTLSHFSPLLGPSSARCVNLVSNLRCTSCPVVLMVLNHTFKVSFVLEGMASSTCYSEAFKGVDLQDTSYSAITAQMNTLCLLVNAKLVSLERDSARITSAPYNCSSCYSLNAAPFEVNMIVAYGGTTTSLISKVIHLQTELKAYPRIFQTEAIFKRPCHSCCVMTSAFFFHVYMTGYILCTVFIMCHIFLSPLIPPVSPCWLKIHSRGEQRG